MKKTNVLAFITSLILSSAAMAGTSSAGGLFRSQKATINCQYKSGNGYEVKATVVIDPSSGYYNATVQESTLDGFLAPVNFQRISHRIQGDIEKYEGKGFLLLIDGSSGLNTLPPIYEGRLSVKDVAYGEMLPVSCVK